MQTFTNVDDHIKEFMKRKELSKAKRLESMSKRLHVNMDGWKSSYEDI